MGRRLDLGRQIHADVYDALRALEENELGDYPLERVLQISSLAGELAKALNDLCRCYQLGTPVEKGNGQASEAHTVRNEGRSPSE